MSTTKKGAKSAKAEKAINAVKAGQEVRTAELQTAGEVAAQVIEDAKKAMTEKQQAAQEKMIQSIIFVILIKRLLYRSICIITLINWFF